MLVCTNKELPNTCKLVQFLYVDYGSAGFTWPWLPFSPGIMNANDELDESYAANVIFLA